MKEKKKCRGIERLELILSKLELLESHMNTNREYEEFKRKLFEVEKEGTKDDMIRIRCSKKLKEAFFEYKRIKNFPTLSDALAYLLKMDADLARRRAEIQFK